MKLILSFFLFAFVSACSSVPSVKEMTIRMGDTDDIEVTDMRSIIRNGLLTTQASVSNKGNSSQVAYRFKWLGKDGMRAFDDEAWKPLTLPKGQSIEIMGIAPTPDAVDFRLEFSSYK